MLPWYISNSKPDLFFFSFYICIIFCSSPVARSERLLSIRFVRKKKNSFKIRKWWCIDTRFIFAQCTEQSFLGMNAIHWESVWHNMIIFVLIHLFFLFFKAQKKGESEIIDQHNILSVASILVPWVHVSMHFSCAWAVVEEHICISSQLIRESELHYPCQCKQERGFSFIITSVNFSYLKCHSFELDVIESLQNRVE